MTDLEQLRFPLGRYTPVENNANASAEHIRIIGLLPKRLCAAIAGLSDSQLDTPYRDGGWTVRQVVHHIADSHANSFVRFKLALTEDWPTIKPYDEKAWAELPDSKTLPLDSSLSFITGMHERWVALLEAMSEADFERGYVHPERGKQDLATALALYAWHCRHHTAHITALRTRNNW